MRDFGGAVCAVPAISRAIPSDVFDGLKSDRWNSVDSALVWGWAELELRAKLRGLVFAMVLVPQGHCSASLPLQCCAIWCIGLVSSASLAFSVQRVARLKPLSPLRPGFRGGGFMWARKSSPCGAASSRKRERVRPARLKHPKFGVFAPCWASFFAERPLEAPCRARFFAPTGAAPRSCWRRAPPLEPRDRLDSGGL